MYKKINNIPKILAIFSVITLLTLSASAQDEEGAIPKIWEKLTGKNHPSRTSPATPAVSEQEKAPEVSNKSAPVMTKEEMIQQIKDEVEANEDLLERIPELKKSKDKDGREFYTYSKGEETVNIENLDADRLNELFNKVCTQANTYQANMAAQQMEIIKENQRVSAAQQQQQHTPPPQSPQPPAPPPQPQRR